MSTLPDSASGNAEKPVRVAVRNTCVRVVACAVTLVVFFFAGITRAADSGKPLAALVGEDAGLCVEINDLETHLAGFLKSEIRQRLSATTVFKSWRGGPEFKQLETAIGHVEKLTAKSVGKLTTDLFGRSVILAAYPNSGEEPTGVLLTRTRSREALDEALLAWHRAAPKDVVTKLKFRDQRYFRRVTHKPEGKSATGNKGQATVFYAMLGSVFAFSDRESAIRDVIGRSLVTGGKSLANSKLYQNARSALTGKPAATVFFNPRKWDESIQFHRKDRPRNPVAEQLWKQCRSVIAGVRLDGGCVAEVVADFEPDGLPAAWSRFAEQTAGAADFLSRIPKQAVFAIAGKNDPNLVSAAIRLTLGKETNKKQWEAIHGYARAVLHGVDISTDLLPNLGSNGGIYVVPRATSNKTVFPFDGLSALEIVAAANKPAARRFRDKLDRGLGIGVNFLATFYNLSVAKNGNNVRRRLAEVQSEKRHGTLIRWIEGVGEYRPAVALTKRYLVVASSPDLIENFVASGKNNSLQSDATFQRWKREYFPRGNQLIFVNVRGLREHVRSVRPVLTSWLAGSKPDSPKNAGQRLEGVLDLLAVIDGAFAAAHIGESRIRLVVGGVVKPSDDSPKATKRD